MGKGKDQELALKDQTNILPKKQLIIVFCALACALLISFIDQNAVGIILPTAAKVRAPSVPGFPPSQLSRHSHDGLGPGYLCGVSKLCCGVSVVAHFSGNLTCPGPTAAAHILLLGT